MSERVAIIGGGMAGLTAAWLLKDRHEITLFEKDDRLGGNAYTFLTRQGDDVDIAVAAFGRVGYKQFFRLLGRLGIPTVASAGSFVSIHDLDTKTGVYFTPSLAGLRAQSFALLRPKTILGTLKIYPGLARARRMLVDGRLRDLTVGQALDAIPEMKETTRIMFLCALSLLSSMEIHEVLAAPAEFFVDKLTVHNDVISPRSLYSVRLIRGGTRRYVDAMAADLRGRIVLNARIRAVLRRGGIKLIMEDSSKREFDQVVFAANADQALALLEAPTEAERQLLGAWKYKDGRVVVHNDYSAFPTRELMQAYTFLYRERDGKLGTSVNGSLCHEPGVRKTCDYISSQHPNFPIRKESIALDVVLRTPIFSRESCATIPLLPALSGVNRTFYCGSHFGHGLHEDAVASAARVARALGGSSL